jgi:hypothetical protein
MSDEPSRSQQRYGRPPCEPASEPTISFEVLVAGGEEGAELRVAQARAIKELLEWMATKRRQQRTST